MAPALHIRRIRPEETLGLRALVLSELVGPSPAVLPLDLAPGSVHIGGFLAAPDPRVGAEYQPGKGPVAVMSIYREAYHDPTRVRDAPERQMQIHKFAVHLALQGNGIGSVVLRAAEREVAGEEPVLLHLDTRLPQVAFYQRAGYVITEEAAFVKYKETGVELMRLAKVVPS